MNDKIRGVDCNGEYIHDSDLECKAMNDSEVFKIAEFVINSDEIGDKEEAISTSHKMARWILDHKWRRVEDGLPEDREDVLVSIKHCQEGEDYFISCSVGCHVEKHGWFTKIDCDWDYTEVTHWQPKPQPPEEE